MRAEAYGIPFFYGYLTFLRKDRIKKLSNHGKGFGIADDFHFRVQVDQSLYIACMIWFQMGNYKIVRLLITQSRFQVLKPCISAPFVHGIHNCDLIVKDNVRIVGNAIWNYVLAFK